MRDDYQSDPQHSRERDRHQGRSSDYGDRYRDANQWPDEGSYGENRNRMGHRGGQQHSRSQGSQGSEYGRTGGEYESGEWQGSGYDDWQSDYMDSRGDRNLERRSEYGGYEGSGRPGGGRRDYQGSERYGGGQGQRWRSEQRGGYGGYGGREQGGGYSSHDDFGGYAGRGGYGGREGYGGQGPQDDYAGYAGRGGYGAHQGYGDDRRDTGYGGYGGYGGGDRHSGRGGGYGTGAGQMGQAGGFERGSTFSSPGGRPSNWRGAWDQSSQGSHHERGYGMDPGDYGSQHSYGSQTGNYGSEHGGYGSQHGGQGREHGGYGSQGARRSMPKGYQRSDERIREDVCERLSHSGLDVSDVSVHVSSGHVTLEGTVDSRHVKHAIENCADDCMGVQDVENRIRVQRQGASPTGYSQTGGTHTGQSGSGGSTSGKSSSQGGASTSSSSHSGTGGSAGAGTGSSGSGTGGTATGSSGIGADPERGGTGKTKNDADTHGSTQSGGTGTGVGKR